MFLENPPLIFRQLPIPSAANELASEKSFEIGAYSLASLAQPEQTRQPRIVRIGAIQNAIVLPTDKPVLEQVGKLNCVKLEYSDTYSSISNGRQCNLHEGAILNF